MNKKYYILGLILFFTSQTYGQKTTVDISSLTRFEPSNRDITITENNAHKSIVFLDAKPNQGVAWLNDLDFSNGTIEFDVKGKNVAQESFVGLAYHGVNDSTFDAIYFRPFNFLSTNKESNNHCLFSWFETTAF